MFWLIYSLLHIQLSPLFMLMMYVLPQGYPTLRKINLLNSQVVPCAACSPFFTRQILLIKQDTILLTPQAVPGVACNPFFTRCILLQSQEGALSVFIMTCSHLSIFSSNTFRFESVWRKKLTSGNRPLLDSPLEA